MDEVMSLKHTFRCPSS